MTSEEKFSNIQSVINKNVQAIKNLNKQADDLDTIIQQLLFESQAELARPLEQIRKKILISITPLEMLIDEVTILARRLTLLG